MLIRILIAALAVCALPARAADIDVAESLTIGLSHPDPAVRLTSNAYLRGLVVGIAAGSYTSSQLNGGKPEFFCAPASLTSSEMRSAFQGYLVQHIDALQIQSSYVMALAMKESYPCR